MTVRYAVVAFPAFGDRERIEAVRRRFDPLAEVLAAHVTLVFPFEETSALGAWREEVAAVASGTSQFEIELAGPEVEQDGYVSLPVLEGSGSLIELHDRLYAGALAPHLSSVHVYLPHVTVGRHESAERQAVAAAEARAMLAGPMHGRVEELAIFRLENGPTGVTGVVEDTLKLGAARMAP